MKVDEISKHLQASYNSIIEKTSEKKSETDLDKKIKSTISKAILELKSELAEEEPVGFVNRQIQEYENSPLAEDEVKKRIDNKIILEIKYKINKNVKSEYNEKGGLTKEEAKLINDEINQMFNVKQMIQSPRLKIDEIKETPKNPEEVSQFRGEQRKAHPRARYDEDWNSVDQDNKFYPKDVRDSKPTKLRFAEEAEVHKRDQEPTKEKLKTPRGPFKRETSRKNIQGFDGAAVALGQGNYKMTTNEFSRILNVKSSGYFKSKGNPDFGYTAQQVLTSIVEELIPQKLSFSKFCSEVKKKLKESNKEEEYEFTKEEFRETFFDHTKNKAGEFVHYWTWAEDNDAFKKLAQDIESGAWKDGEKRKYKAPRLSDDSMKNLNTYIGTWSKDTDMQKVYTNLTSSISSDRRSTSPPKEGYFSAFKGWLAGGSRATIND